MGSNVHFIAFRQAPDVEKLAAIPGLTGFRLFKHSTKPEWYLEGPNPEGDDITFFEPLDYAPKGEAFNQSKSALQELIQAFNRAELNPYGLDKKALASALTICNELNIATLLIYSNDDGIDAGFICNAGKVSHAKLPNLPKAMAVFENGAAHLESPQSKEFDEGEPVLDLHQYASEVASRFFAETIRWRVTSDPFEFKGSDYILISGAGKHMPRTLWGEDIAKLRSIDSSHASGRRKLQESIALIDKHVAAALHERLIASERPERDLVEGCIWACRQHATLFRQPSSVSLGMVEDYLAQGNALSALAAAKARVSQFAGFSSRGAKAEA
jgi:hypothetical protein